MEHQNGNSKNQKLVRFASWVVDHKILVVLFCLLVGGGSIAVSLDLVMDNSLEAYFMNDDPSFAYYKDFMKEYGNDEFLYIVYTHKKDVFNLDVLKVTQKLVADLEEVPFVKKIHGLTNVEFMESNELGDLKIFDLMADFPETQEQADQIKKKLMAKPIYVESFISKDGKYAAVLCEVEDKPDDDPNYHQKIGHGLKQVLGKSEFKDFRFWPVGEPVLNSEFYELIEESAVVIAGLSFVLTFGFLVVLFRQTKAFFGPWLVVMFSILIVVGFIGVMGYPITAMFQMMPSLLIAIGVATSVHLINEYQIHLRAGNDNRSSILKSVELVGIPCLFTTITTAVGIGSLTVSPVKAIKEYGRFSMFGVMGIFLFSFTIMLVVLAVSGKRTERHFEKQRKRNSEGRQHLVFLDKLLAGIAALNKKHYGKILIVVGIFSAICIYGITRLEINSSYLEEIGDSAKIYQDYRFVDDKMGGSGNFELLLNSGEPDGVKTLQFAKTLEKIQSFIDSKDDFVRKTNSINDIIKDVNQSLNNNDKAYSRIPDSDQAVSQYILLYEMSGGEDLEKLVSADIAEARLTILTKYSDTKTAEKFNNELEAYIPTILPEGYTYNITGASYMLVKSMGHIEKTQIESITLALGVISLMMIVVFRSIKVGLVSMLPNVFPIVVTLGFMGLAGIWLDYVRTLIACIAIGLAVDDTIHFIFRYKMEFKRLGSYEKALDVTMSDVGRAITITTIILMMGFGASMISKINDMHYFGMLASMCIFVALLSDYFICPALILLTKPFGKEFDSLDVSHQSSVISNSSPLTEN